MCSAGEIDEAGTPSTFPTETCVGMTDLPGAAWLRSVGHRVHQTWLCLGQRQILAEALA